MKFLFLLILCTYSYSHDISVKEYFKNCDQILENTNFRSCYNYNFKSVVVSYARLYSDNIDSLNISQRPGFYEDTRIPGMYRIKPIYYYYKGFDKGHIQSDANNDYNYNILKETYAMSNIVPMYPNTNRYSFLNVEKYEREMTRKYKELEVLTIVYYGDKIEEYLHIPEYFVKILFNNQYKSCYKIPNDNMRYNLHEMEIDCESNLKSFSKF